MVSCYRIVFRFLCKREPFRKVGRSPKKTNRCTYIILLHFLVFSLEVLYHTMHTILWSYNDGVSSECTTQAYKQSTSVYNFFSFSSLLTFVLTQKTDNRTSDYSLTSLPDMNLCVQQLVPVQYLGYKYEEQVLLNI